MPQRGRHAHLWFQRCCSGATMAIMMPAIYLILRVGRRWSFEGLRDARREFLRIRRETTGPLLVCANHLTLLDSFVIAYSLTPLWKMSLTPSSVPWNVPEATYFATTIPRRLALYLCKCLPIQRRGNRKHIADTLDDFVHVVSGGDIGMIFPEGGRSPTGRVDAKSPAYGVGRVVDALPGCRVVCVYLRGDGQETSSVAPRRGERFRIRISTLEPKSDENGFRRSADLSCQILMRLAEMERAYFSDVLRIAENPPTVSRLGEP